MKRLLVAVLMLNAFTTVGWSANVRVHRVESGSPSGAGAAPEARPHAQPVMTSQPVSRGQRGTHYQNNGPRSYSERTRVRPASGKFATPARVDRTAVGLGGTRIVRQNVTPVPSGHSPIAGNTRVVRSIQRDRRVDVVPNRTYWHNNGGVRYAHTYRGGVHWYGFYHGSDFYWTRYHRDRWWWYDPGFNHWVFWANGYWWWNGPGDALYVYANDGYYPYSVAAVNVAAPVAAPVAASAPAVDAATENTGGTWTSPDGQRMIQIQGAQSEAFLYDSAGAQPRYLAYLGSNVERVRFSGGQGSPLRVLVDFKNGDFTLFSAEGEPIDLQPPAVPSDDTPSPPADLPQ